MSAEHPPRDEPSPGSSAVAEKEEATEKEKPSGPEQQGDPRYASQAAAAEPAPVAFEGGAGVPENEATTPRREWVFLTLAVFFSLAVVAIPAILFTSIDLTGSAGDAASEAEDSEAAREVERLQLLQETREEALSKLNTYGPIEDGAFRIPVERAMQLTLKEDYSAASSEASSFGNELKLAIPGGAKASGTSLETRDTTARR